MARYSGLSLSNALGFYLKRMRFLDCGSYRSGCLDRGGYRSQLVRHFFATKRATLFEDTGFAIGATKQAQKRPEVACGRRRPSPAYGPLSALLYLGAS
jgi:hypothetical protein